MSNKVSGNRRRQYLLEFIPDPTLYRAVMFARTMMREGTPPATANSRAAAYYHVSVSDVAHYTGKVGAACARRKRRK